MTDFALKWPKLGSCEKDCMSHKSKIFTVCPSRKILLTLVQGLQTWLILSVLLVYYHSFTKCLPWHNKCICPCNHQHNQDVEHFHPPTPSIPSWLLQLFSHSPSLVVFLQCPRSKARSRGLYLEVLHKILKRIRYWKSLLKTSCLWHRFRQSHTSRLWWQLFLISYGWWWWWWWGWY